MIWPRPRRESLTRLQPVHSPHFRGTEDTWDFHPVNPVHPCSNSLLLEEALSELEMILALTLHGVEGLVRFP